jgi:hypothetical protein
MFRDEDERAMMQIKLTISPYPRDFGCRLVTLAVRPFDDAWKRARDFYVGLGGAGGNPYRYNRFLPWLLEYGTSELIYASDVEVDDDGSVRFGDGRHRFAVLRDHGLVGIPVAMWPSSIEPARKYGYLRRVHPANWRTISLRLPGVRAFRPSADSLDAVMGPPAPSEG